MALPKNKKIRRITIDNIEYYWTSKFDEIYGLVTCNVGLVEKPNQKFNFIRGVDSTHIQYVQNGIKKKDTIRAITPKLVKEAIEFANKNLDWKNKKECWLSSNSEGFSLRQE